MVKRKVKHYIKCGRISVGNNTAKIKFRAYMLCKAIHKLYLYQYKNTKEDKYRNILIKHMDEFDPKDIDEWANN